MRWTVAERVADALDAAIAAGDVTGIARLPKVLDYALERASGSAAVRPAEPTSELGEVTPDDDDQPRRLSLDEQYERLCADMGDPANPES